MCEQKELRLPVGRRDRHVRSAGLVGSAYEKSSKGVSEGPELPESGSAPQRRGSRVEIEHAAWAESQPLRRNRSIRLRCTSTPHLMA